MSCLGFKSLGLWVLRLAVIVEWSARSRKRSKAKENPKQHLRVLGAFLNFKAVYPEKALWKPVQHAT